MNPEQMNEQLLVNKQFALLQAIEVYKKSDTSGNSTEVNVLDIIKVANTFMNFMYPSYYNSEDVYVEAFPQDGK